jgi:hypothetical protein
VLASQLIETLVNNHITSSLLIDDSKRTPAVANLVIDLAKLLLLGLETLPTSMDRHLDRCSQVVNTLESEQLKKHNFLSEAGIEHVHALKRAYIARIELKADGINQI